MRSFWGISAHSYHPIRIHPALTSFADEFCGTLARLVAYVCTLALFAILGIYLWDQLPEAVAAEPAPEVGWSVVSRAEPAFAVSQFDLSEKTETYEILQHDEGGRRDTFRWSTQGQEPVAELEIYRPGGEFGQSGPSIAEITARIDPNGSRALESAGVIDSKFGNVALVRVAGGGDKVDGRACLGFVKHIDEPNLRISGWSCLGDTLPDRRAAIGCILSRLVLLTAGNEPKLADLFARAELKRSTCAISAPSADWVTATGNPLLRGTF